MVADPAAWRPRFGVAGHPVAHSLSPQMHSAAYKALGIEADYQLLPVPPELFEETVRALPDSGFRGINVTIPHKEAALALADSASAATTAIGAANTLNFANGRIEAENTDAAGLTDLLGGDLSGATALVIGAGGTARAAIYALTAAGASVGVWNRTAEKATTLAEEFGAVSVPAVADAAPGANIVVNTTAAGMDSDDESAVLESLGLGLESLAPGTMLVDYPYSPSGSPLTVAARRLGITVVDGLDLLVAQGARSFALWFGRPAPREAMRAAIS